MAKAKTQAKKAKPSASDKRVDRLSLVKKTSKKVVKAAAKLVKAATGAKAPAKAAPAKVAPAKAAPAKVAPVKAAPAKAAVAPPPVKASGPVAKAAPGKAAPVTKGAPAAPPPAPAKGGKGKGKGADAIPTPDRPRPRASKLPPPVDPLNKRDMEQVLTVGVGRGVFGEGGLKGKLAVKDGFPFLLVVGRDKRELSFLLEGPDQEVLPAYADHKVSVSGLIRKTHNHGGTVSVRKYSAKKPEAEGLAPVVEQEQKLRFLSPGELEQMCSAGMGAGMKGFGTVRGNLEMTGEEFFLVVSGAGTRHQVSFLLDGKVQKSMRKHLGHTLSVHGVVDKQSGWGGRIEMETFEVRAPEHRVSREGMELVQVEGLSAEKQTVDVRMNHGLSVRLPEKPGFTWAIEPTTAKRVGLREANFEPSSSGPGTREFLFTPRNPGAFDIEFFLVKAFQPAQVSRTYVLGLQVKA